MVVIIIIITIFSFEFMLLRGTLGQGSSVLTAHGITWKALKMLMSRSHTYSF